jgi:hypothetical protein
LRSASASEMRSPVQAISPNRVSKPIPRQTRGWPKPLRGGEQIDDLTLAVDVRGLPLR